MFTQVVVTEKASFSRHQRLANNRQREKLFCNTNNVNLLTCNNLVLLKIRQAPCSQVIRTSFYNTLERRVNFITLCFGTLDSLIDQHEALLIRFAFKELLFHCDGLLFDTLTDNTLAQQITLKALKKRTSFDEVIHKRF